MANRRNYIHKDTIAPSGRVKSSNALAYEKGDIKEDDQGYFYLVGRILQSGLMNYLASEIFGTDLPDGVTANDVIEVWIEDHEIHRSSHTFSLKPLTLDHPEKTVDSDSFKEVAVGVVGDIHVVENGINAGIRVFDKKAKAKISDDSKTTELSCGFWSSVEVGTDGRLYHKNIVADHVAIVDKGRCGAGCSLLFSINSKSKGEKKVQVKLGGQTVEIEDKNAATIVQAAFDNQQNIAVRESGKAAALKIQVDSLKLNQMDTNKINAAAKERASLLSRIEDKAGCDDLDNKQLKVKILNAANITVPESVEEAFIDGMMSAISDGNGGISKHIVNSDEHNQQSESSMAMEGFNGVSK